MKRLVLLFTTSMVFLMTFSQQDTLKAIYQDVVTGNKEIINFSNALENLPEGDSSILLRGINIFCQLSDNIKDTALLIFLYHQRKFSFFDNNAVDESSFYNEYDTPDFEKVKLYNEYLKKFGFKLITISHGYISTITLPGFIESQLKDSVSAELRKYLSYYTLQENIVDLIYSGNYSDYIRELGNSLYMSEELILNNNFCKEHIKRGYYSSLVSFIFYDPEFALSYGLESFNIMEPEFLRIMNELIEKAPAMKTSLLIKTIKDATKQLAEEDIESLYLQMENEECDLSYDCECNNDYFNFDNIQKNLNEMLACFETE